jgi:aconitase B
VIGENDHHATGGVDPWNRLVTLIDNNLNMPIHNHQLVIEFWRAGMRDAELGEYGKENWARYRAHFLETVVDGCAKGVFRPTLSPEEAVDLLLAMLAGIVITRVLQFRAPAADVRTTLLHAAAQMLGRVR